MANRTKIVGNVPIYKGDWVSGTSYYKMNQVTYMGSTFQSKVNNNTDTPATVNADGSYNVHANWVIAAKGFSKDYVDDRLNTPIANANAAAVLANEKAGLANTAAVLATEKAGLATTAATNANTKITEMTALGTQLGQAEQGRVVAEQGREAAEVIRERKIAEMDKTYVKNVDVAAKALASLLTPYGITYNEASMMFSYNGLTDITYTQMLQAYEYTYPLQYDNKESYRSLDVRIFFKKRGSSGAYLISLDRTFAESKLENIGYISLQSNTTALLCRDLSLAFFNCKVIKKISQIIDINAISSPSLVDRCFYGCEKLEIVYLKTLKVSISVGQSPILAYDSIKYLIDNSASTTAITVTLHATALDNARTAYLSDSTADLATYPTLDLYAASKNISLAV